LRNRSLMLSTAAIAILSGAAYADTTVDSSKTDAYTTGALLTTNTGTPNAGNITVTTAGSIAPSVASQGAITVNTDNWVLIQGTVTNKNKDGAHGIHVDLSADRDLSGASFTNLAGTTITGTGIYLDTGSTLSTTGTNSGKYGIYLDANSCAASACTYKGDITQDSGSMLTVTGDSSSAFQFSTKSVLQGDLTLGGGTTVSSNTTTSTPTTIYGLFAAGQINGNVSLPAGASMAVYGDGGRGISIQGGGVDGYISIGGSIATSMPATTTTSITTKINTTTNPEAASALEVGADVTGGIAILGPTTPGSTTATASLSVGGTGAAILISPSVNAQISAPTAPLTIGVFTGDTADPGFSFYNRGAIKIVPNNYNDYGTAVAMSGYNATSPTVLPGGFFNSGSIGSTATTSGSTVTTSGVQVIGLSIGDWTQLGVGSPTYPKNPGDGAALVNSGDASTAGGSILATIGGTRGGLAYGVLIGANASVPSIINSGTIGALAGTTDKTLAGNTSGSTNPLAATAILDESGTLTSIINSGTISAEAGYQPTGSETPSALDNDTQLATAIDLSHGSATTASAAGVTIQNYSSSTRAATITGNIVFGTGSNQTLDLVGNGSLLSTVTGNVNFGMIASGSTSNDLLHIGNNAVFTGEVTTSETVRGAGVKVNVDTHGVLTLLNTDVSLNATSVTVANGGTINLGVNQSLTASGGVVAAQNVNLQSGSVLGVTYASFVPKDEHQFVLMTADQGQLQIDPTTLSTYNNTTNRPYLLANANLCMTTQAGCPRPSTLTSSVDALILDVQPKAMADLGLTAGSVTVRAAQTLTGTTTLFDQVNTALTADNVLGAAMIAGIHSAKEAQQSYDQFAPNLTGGTRAIVISITDQATGPVAARERMLNMYGKTDGGMTLWGQQFVQMLKDPGKGSIDVNTGFKTDPGFKDHGFGFALGVDGGSPKFGWYGGALTFYAGDVNELARNAHENQQWYLLSLYSVWRGKGLFLDTKLDAGYGHIDGKRTLTLVTSSGAYSREADNKHAGAVISGGVTTGGTFSYGAATLMPQLSLDGMYLREEGYTEYNPSTTTVGDGFDLKVEPYYAKSLRAFAGVDLRYDLNLWDFFLQPEVRAGYRYDFISDPVKLKMAFAYSDTSGPVAAPGTTFQLTGPDPSQGNFVLGGALAATTDAWTLGFNIDFVRGTNGAFQQVGTISLLGKI